jgi:NAD(P)H dehydrogenase (quinone)
MTSRSNDVPIGLTGATGELGGRVARRLAKRGAPQRLVVRDASRAPRLDGAEVRTASGYSAPDEMRAALEGVDTLLLIPATEAIDRAEQHKSAVDGAVAAGVSHIVYLSFVGASPDATFTLARHHWATEEHIRASGVSFTFLRMSLYMDFIPFMAGADGVIRGPAGDGRVGAVLRDDIADVAVEVLLDPGAHDRETYDVTGREAFTLAEAAATMARLSGKPIRFEDETIDEAWASRRPSGEPDWIIEGWVSSYVAIAHGELDVVSDTVRRIVGHEPVTLPEFAGAHPESLEHVQGA